MTNKWIKRLFPIITLLLLAPLSATYAYASSDDTAAQNTVQIEATEALVATSISTVDTITAPEEILPSHVYVLNNQEIVTEKPSSVTDELPNTVEEPSSQHQTASPSATIRASVKGASSRLIVVDENDRIIEIWSNTDGANGGFYSLRIKEQRVEGLEHPLTPEILAQYNRLLDEVDWNARDQVYG